MASGAAQNYPVSLDLRGRRCLVVGGGAVGTRKATALLEAGALVRLIAPTLTPALTHLVGSGEIDDHRSGEYRPSDLDGCVLAIAATGDHALNRLIADDAAAAGVLVNVVDDPRRSSFTVPATGRLGAITLAVSTDGASPVLARHLRTEFEAALSPASADLAALLAEIRDELKEAFPEPAERAAVVDGILRSDVLDLLERGDRDGAEEVVRRVLDGVAPQGNVALVGAGPGDPRLLTLRGATLVRRADVIVHDRLGTEGILQLAPSRCELVDVGKTPGRHGMAQDEINALLVRLARDGRRVVRLKGGDPFVFGRGGEEALALAAAGVAFEVVPGVSSAIGAAGVAGVPVTHRGIAQAVTIASGHDDPSAPAAVARWQALGAAPGTIVLMMAMTNLAAIADALVAGGRSADEPALAIHWATTSEHREVSATLGTLADVCAAAGVGNPSVVVIGPVVEVGRQIAAGLRASTSRPV